MRWMVILILVGRLSFVQAQQEDARNPQVNAATADALESLKREVNAAHITPELTVADLLDKVGGRDELEKTLRGAEQLGGARWLSDQAVQVRLSIDGSRISKMLLEIEQTHAKRSPIPAEKLGQALRSWADRTFSATGTSTGAADVTCLRPAPSDRAWLNVTDINRRAALITARDNAVSHVLESLATLPLDGKSLGQALAEPSVSQQMKAWLAGRPVKSVEFGDDLSIRLTLAVVPEDFWPVLRTALNSQNKIPLPATQADWDRLQAEVIAQVAPAAGIGTVQSAVPPAAVPAVVLPSQAPPWSMQKAEAEATSPDDGARLRTARRAEVLALEKMRTQLEALPLGEGVTLGDAARRDPSIKKALNHALGRAHPFQVDYGAKGSVTVHISLRLSDLWADLTGQQ